MEFGLAVSLIIAAALGGFYWGFRNGRKVGYVDGERNAHLMYVNLPGLGRAIDMKQAKSDPSLSPRPSR